jgi:hypothetical protein
MIPASSNRLGDALAVKADLELAGEVLRTLRGAEVEQVVPLAHAPHAFVEMRRAQQRVQLPLAHARREAAQVGDVRIDAFLQRGLRGLREVHGGGFGRTLGGRRMAAAGGQQAIPRIRPSVAACWPARAMRCCFIIPL